MVAVGSWDGAEPRHLVSLYAEMHARVYGAPPLELFGDAWRGAVSAAEKMLRVEFGGDAGKAVEFLRWVWKRERDREQARARRQEQQGAEDEGRRISWRFQFVLRMLLGDYRVAMARAGKRVNE